MRDSIKSEIICVITIIFFALISLSGCIDEAVNSGSQCCISGFIILIVLIMTYAFLRGGNLRKPNVVETKVDSPQPVIDINRRCPSCGRIIPNYVSSCPYCNKQFLSYNPNEHKNYKISSQKQFDDDYKSGKLNVLPESFKTNNKPETEDKSLNLYKSAIEFIKKNEFDIALKCINRAIELNSNESSHWYAKGLIHASIDEADEALNCFDKSLELDPKNELAIKEKKEIQKLTHKSYTCDSCGLSATKTECEWFESKSTGKILCKKCFEEFNKK